MPYHQLTVYFSNSQPQLMNERQTGNGHAQNLYWFLPHRRVIQLCHTKLPVSHVVQIYKPSFLVCVILSIFRYSSWFILLVQRSIKYCMSSSPCQLLYCLNISVTELTALRTIKSLKSFSACFLILRRLLMSILNNRFDGKKN